MPTPAGSRIDYSRKPLIVNSSMDLGCDINYWESPLGTNQIICRYQVDGMARKPPSTQGYIERSLTNGRFLTQQTNALRILSILLSAKNDEDKVRKIKKYLVKRLKYEYPPKTREAASVIKSGKSDCGGYHAAFVTLLRMSNIPAVMDFGYMAPGVDNPHVWAWWFNKEENEWIMEDLNDLQEDRKYTDRISMTLGTEPNLQPPYPKPVVFLQSHLCWIDKLDDLQKKGLMFSHDSVYRVTR